MDTNTIEKNALECLKSGIVSFPENYTLLDKHLFLFLYQTYFMFNNKTISREQGTELKLNGINEYNSRVKWFELADKMNNKFIEQISITEKLRCELHKQPTLEVALQLIEIYSGEQFPGVDNV